MKKILAALLPVLFCSSLAWAGQTDDLLKQADALYPQREVVKSAEKNLALYEQILSIDPANYEAAWKASQTCKWLGDVYPKDEKLAILEKGESFAKKAVEINADGIDGHYWLGISMGRIGEEKGVLNSLFLVGPIKDEMEKVLKADPKHDGAHHVLSVLYRKAPGWPLSIGDTDKALEYAKLSVEERPTRPLNRLGLAEVYMNKGMNKEAAEQLNAAISMALEPDRIPEGKDEKIRAKALLAEVNKKLTE